MSYVKNFFVVMKRNHFAIFQCLLMILMILLLLVFGGFKFSEAHNSVTAKYKPFKVERKDEFYDNKELTYQIPIHYFMFEMIVQRTSFYETYNQTFNETCKSSVETCLTTYFDNFLNIDYALQPTVMPTDGPTRGPTSKPTKIMTGIKPGPDLNIAKAPSGQPNLWEDYSSGKKNYSVPVYAWCKMTSSNNGTLETNITDMKNISFSVDSIGIEPFNEENPETIEVFGMLLKMEFEDIREYKGGWFRCDLYVEMEEFNQKFSSFAEFEIFFMVSRSDYYSATPGSTSYLRSRKNVWHNTDNAIEKVYNYVYEESTFDGVSDIAAEVYLEQNISNIASLNIETYPYPTVIHYVSYVKYSYIDWIADVGGFYTLVISIFYILSTRVTYFANRNDAFHRRQGILPALSMTYRNAEELSGLRYLVLAAFGIPEEAYFADDFQKFLDESRF